MYTSVHARAAAAYRRVAAETSVLAADPHHLVTLLFDALLQHVATAKGALERGDIAAKGRAIGKAVRIIEEGLKAGLNTTEGGEIAANLHRLYDYCVLRLTSANLHNRSADLDQVARLIEPIAQSWKLIANGSVPPASRPAPLLED
jgi:flagellar protein FliS